MSKEHYIAMAKAIKEHQGKPFEMEHIKAIAIVFKEQSAAFSEEKFFAYIEKK